MTEKPFSHHLKSTRPFGCLSAGLLALGLGFIVLVGTRMSDCDPGCHDRDGALILSGLMWTLPIAVFAGAACWLLVGVLRMIGHPWIGTLLMNVTLAAVTLLLTCFSFYPAMALLAIIVLS